MGTSQTLLQMGFFDFKPIHGSGTGSSDNDLDEQYRIQQEILEERRKSINFESLHKKYSKEKQDLDVFSLGFKHVHDKYQDSYVENEAYVDNEEESKDKMDDDKMTLKFPWNLKP